MLGWSISCFRFSQMPDRMLAFRYSRIFHWKIVDQTFLPLWQQLNLRYAIYGWSLRFVVELKRSGLNEASPDVRNVTMSKVRKIKTKIKSKSVKCFTIKKKFLFDVVDVTVGENFVFFLVNLSQMTESL